MSTFTISASGTRAVTTTLGDPAYTNAAIAARMGDSATISGNSFARVRLCLAGNVPIRRVRTPNRTYNSETKEYEDAGTRDYYEISLGSGFFMICDGGENLTPHVGIHVRKDLEDADFSFIAKSETLETLTFDELYERVADEVRA